MSRLGLDGLATMLHERCWFAPHKPRMVTMRQETDNTSLGLRGHKKRLLPRLTRRQPHHSSCRIIIIGVTAGGFLCGDDSHGMDSVRVRDEPQMRARQTHVPHIRRRSGSKHCDLVNVRVAFGFGKDVHRAVASCDEDGVVVLLDAEDTLLGGEVAIDTVQRLHWHLTRHTSEMKTCQRMKHSLFFRRLDVIQFQYLNFNFNPNVNRTRAENLTKNQT
jgi:hypothetical protein